MKQTPWDELPVPERIEPDRPCHRPDPTDALATPWSGRFVRREVPAVPAQRSADERSVVSTG